MISIGRAEGLKKKKTDSPPPAENENRRRAIKGAGMKMKNIHPKQIPTKLCIIRAELWETGTTAVELLMNCLLSEPNSSKQKLRRHFYLNEFLALYIGEKTDRIANRRSKSITGRYSRIMPKHRKKCLSGLKKYGVSPEKAEHIHKLIWQTADLICPMIACLSEQTFVSEYAYAIEYVINHNGNLPKPKFSCLFPTNYTDYHYNESIAKEIAEALKPFCYIL